MHNHKHCHHKLSFCEQCDVAYCEKCGKEWRNRPYFSYPVWGNTYTVKTDESIPNVSFNPEYNTAHICT